MRLVVYPNDVWFFSVPTHSARGVKKQPGQLIEGVEQFHVNRFLPAPKCRSTVRGRVRSPLVRFPCLLSCCSVDFRSFWFCRSPLAHSPTADRGSPGGRARAL